MKVVGTNPIKSGSVRERRKRLGGGNVYRTLLFLAFVDPYGIGWTLGSQNLIGVGTNLKFYIENGGAYNDITPLRATVSLTNPFTTTSGSPTVSVVDANGGYTSGDFVTFSGCICGWWTDLKR